MRPGRLRRREEPTPRPGSARIVQLLLDFLQRFTPCRCLRTILEQFDDLLIWGHYLNRLDWDADKAAAREAECRGYFEQLRGALAVGTRSDSPPEFRTFSGRHTIWPLPRRRAAYPPEGCRQPCRLSG